MKRSHRYGTAALLFGKANRDHGDVIIRVIARTARRPAQDFLLQVIGELIG
jgi:hypothetical protein